jgi:hypothetical protein
METKINLNEQFVPILTSQQTIDFLLCGNHVTDCVFDDTREMALIKECNNLLTVPIKIPNDKSIEDSLLRRIDIWNIPDEFKSLDIEKYILGLCIDDIERKRVQNELIEFKNRNLYPLLQCLVYIVSVFRKNNVVWGVGRGSSVSSYCLFLIGIHKINSIRYNLDIGDFLK